MAYTLTFLLTDLPKIYAGGLPVLGGTISNPVLLGGSGAAFGVATSKPPTLLTLSFTSAAVPPSTPCDVLVTDTGSGGDFCRSGVLTALPPSPAMAAAFAGVGGVSTAQVSSAAASAAIRPTIIPGWIRWLSGLLPAGLYVPLVAVMPAPVVTLGAGTITTTVTGLLAVRFFYFKVATFTFTLTTTMTAAPSSDADVQWLLQTRSHHGSVGFSPDGDYIYFRRGYGLG
jgi:hypothetical protein